MSPKGEHERAVGDMIPQRIKLTIKSNHHSSPCHLCNLLLSFVNFILIDLASICHLSTTKAIVRQVGVEQLTTYTTNYVFTFPSLLSCSVFFVFFFLFTCKVLHKVGYNIEIFLHMNFCFFVFETKGTLHTFHLIIPVVYNNQLQDQVLSLFCTYVANINPHLLTKCQHPRILHIDKHNKALIMFKSSLVPTIFTY